MNKINSVSRALLIIDLINKAEEMSLGEISKFTKLNEATVSHLVSTLVMHGYLKQRKKYGKYSIGAKFLDISQTLKGKLHDHEGIVKHLVELSQLINEDVHVVIWYGSKVLFSKAFDYSDEPIQAIPYEWSKFPLYTICWGKLILACMSDDDIQKYFQNTPLRKITPNTITDVKEMKSNLRFVKREMVAFEFEECIDGVNGVAAGIGDGNGELVGAVSIQGSSSHLTRDLLLNMAPDIKNCALYISRDLGYSLLAKLPNIIGSVNGS